MNIIINIVRNANLDRCVTCGLSKNPETADLVHTRLGLDEPPEPSVYKYKSAYESVILIANNVSQALMSADVDVRTSMDTALNVEVNTAMVLIISRVSLIELGARKNAEISRIVYSCAESGMFGVTISSKITETGCSWLFTVGLRNSSLRKSRRPSRRMGSL